MNALRVLRHHRAQHDARLPLGFTFDEPRALLAVWWSGEEFCVPYALLSTPQNAVRWIRNVTTCHHKDWPGMTPARLGALIAALEARFGWQL